MVRRWWLPLAVIVSSCLSQVPGSAEGFKCERDDDCDAQTRCLAGLCTARPPQDAGVDAGPGATIDGGAPRPMRLGFYLMSYPYSFSDSPPHDPPARGFYSSTDAGVLREHFADLEYGHFSGGVVSWYGPGRSGDSEFALLLQRSAQTSLKWAVVYEREPLDRPDAAVAVGVLDSAAARFAPSARYLTAPDAGFFFFVDDNALGDPCDVAARWVLANESSGHRAWLVLHAPAQGDAHLGCARQPDAWYRTPSTAGLAFTDDFVTVVPGAFASGDSQPRLPRDPARFATALAAAADAGRRIELIDSFNVWSEGTAVEASPSWSSDSGYGVYLDLLHAW